MKKADEWKTRLRIQQDLSNSAYFVTLTYDDEHLPKDDKGNPCFSRKHLKIYHAKMREYLKRGAVFYDSVLGRCEIPLNSRKFKYFLTSEYGPEKGHRPHYHVIYFDLPDDQATAELLVRKSWSYGSIVTLSPLTPGRIGYSAEYAMNAKLCRFAPPDWMDPIFVVSNGVGNFVPYQSSLTDWFRQNPTKRVYFPTPKKNGRMGKAPLARYLKLKLFDEDMRERINAERETHQRSMSFVELQAAQQACLDAVKRVKQKKLHING